MTGLLAAARERAMAGPPSADIRTIVQCFQELAPCFPSAERDPEGAERGNKTEANRGNARAKRWPHNRMLESVAGQTRRLRHLLERISGGAIANLGRRWRDKGEGRNAAERL